MTISPIFGTVAIATVALTVIAMVPRATDAAAATRGAGGGGARMMVPKGGPVSGAVRPRSQAGAPNSSASSVANSKYRGRYQHRLQGSRDLLK